jgi:D-serine dehydratase
MYYVVYTDFPHKLLLFCSTSPCMILYTHTLLHEAKLGTDVTIDDLCAIYEISTTFDETTSYERRGYD